MSAGLIDQRMLLLLAEVAACRSQPSGLLPGVTLHPRFEQLTFRHSCDENIAELGPSDWLRRGAMFWKCPFHMTVPTPHASLVVGPPEMARKRPERKGRWGGVREKGRWRREGERGDGSVRRKLSLFWEDGGEALGEMEVRRKVETRKKKVLQSNMRNTHGNHASFPLSTGITFHILINMSFDIRHWFICLHLHPALQQGGIVPAAGQGQDCKRA